MNSLVSPDSTVLEVQAFTHITPALRLFSGAACFRQLERELDRVKCRRAMIFCGRSLARRPELLALVQEALGDRCAGIFSDVQAHSPVATVEMAAEALRNSDADAVIAIGGGSAIVTARAASILLAEGSDLGSLSTYLNDAGELVSPKLLEPKIPQFIIPTTPTTAIVKAGSAVFAGDSHSRLALFDPKTRAQSVFLHPDFLGSAPRDLIVSASLNTFSMAIEGLLSRQGDPLSDALLMHALRLLVAHLANQELCDALPVRSELILAAILCGQGTDYTGAGITTVLGHALGARFDLENGLVNGILLPHAIRFNAQHAQSSLPKIASALGLNVSKPELSAAPIIFAVGQLLGALGAPRRLREIGVPRDGLNEVAQSAMGDWFLRGNPRPIKSEAELLHVLDEAW